MIKKAFISGFVSVVICIFVFGAATVFGEFPAVSPPGGLVSPSFSSIHITGTGEEGRLWTDWITSDGNVTINPAGYALMSSGNSNITVNAAGIYGIDLVSPKGIRLGSGEDSNVLIEGKTDISYSLIVRGQGDFLDDVIAKKALRVDGDLTTSSLKSPEGVDLQVDVVGEKLDIYGPVSVSDDLTVDGAVHAPGIQQDGSLILAATGADGKDSFLFLAETPLDAFNSSIILASEFPGKNVTINSGDGGQILLQDPVAISPSLHVAGDFDVNGKVDLGLTPVSLNVRISGTGAKTTNTLACPAGKPSMISCNIGFSDASMNYVRGQWADITVNNTCIGHYYSSTAGLVNGTLDALCI